VIVDASAPKKMVAKRIWQTVNGRLKPPAPVFENAAS
jgi:hypothetical protein